MLQYLLVTYALFAVAFATPILVSECGTLDSSFTTYRLASDIAVSNTTYGFVCFDIIGKGITLDGNGFELSSASNTLLPATGVQYHADSTTVTNLRITNFRTGINAKGKFGLVFSNTITQCTNGIDVSATNNRITSNIISNFRATEESTSGIYVYFPALAPVDSYVNITNNAIFDIKGDSFAQGISVYYANSVFIGQNRIYNIEGALMSEAISVIESSVDTFSNVFTAPPTEGVFASPLSALLAVALVVASFVLFRSSSPSLSTLKAEAPVPSASSSKMMEKKEEFEADGADFVPLASKRLSATFSIVGSLPPNSPNLPSPTLGNSLNLER